MPPLWFVLGAAPLTRGQRFELEALRIAAMRDAAASQVGPLPATCSRAARPFAFVPLQARQRPNDRWSAGEFPRFVAIVSTEDAGWSVRERVRPAPAMRDEHEPRFHDVTKTKPSHYRPAPQALAGPKVPVTAEGAALAREVNECTVIGADAKAPLVAEITNHESTHGRCTTSGYNRQRRPSAIGYVSPAEFERRFTERQTA